MATFNQDLVNDFVEKNSKYLNTQESLNNLGNLKNSISEDRFTSQKKEYENEIAKLSPEIQRLTETLEADLSIISQELSKVENKFNKLNDAIAQEKKLYKGKAISKNQYNDSMVHLKKELKEVQPQYKELQQQVRTIKNALTGNLSSPKIGSPIKDGISNIKASSGNGSFGEDFKKGCFVILMILIAIPVVWLLLVSAKGIALILIPILAIILMIAFFGKIINFISSIWR